MKKIYFVSCLLALTLNSNLQAQSEGIASPKWVFTVEGIIDANKISSPQLENKDPRSLLAGRTIKFIDAFEANKNNFKNINLIHAGDLINLPCGDDLSLNVKVKNGESLWLLSKTWNKELKKITRNDSLFKKVDTQLPSVNINAKDQRGTNWKLIYAIIYSLALFLVIVTTCVLIIRKLDFSVKNKE